jgi:hypothetical protein
MDIKSILENTDLRTREFPITATKVFLAHAAMSPFLAKHCRSHK